MSLAKQSKDALYQKAVEAIKMLDPVHEKSIMIDKDSLSMSVYSNTARFSVVRTKNGVPVDNDRGSITLDKNTGELKRFNISWHPRAYFQNPTGAIGEDVAKKCYGDMIGIVPQYEIYKDYEENVFKTRLVYVQSDSGEINAFTGAKSDFATDGYYEDGFFEDAVEEPEEANPSTGKNEMFTEKELAELDKDLPYSTEESVIKLVKSNRYLTYLDGMQMTWSYLSKRNDGGEERYVFSTEFSLNTNGDLYGSDIPEVWEEYPTNYYANMGVTIDAETGELLSYGFYESGNVTVMDYDMEKAEALAEEIAADLGSAHFDEYTTGESSHHCYTNVNTKRVVSSGSSHRFNRVANDITVKGNDIFVSFDANMRLRSYEISYNNVEFADPSTMLSAQQVMDKYWQDNEIDLYYLAQTGKSITKTMLVYGADEHIYRDAFTGEPVYSYSIGTPDLSGITDKTVLKKAQLLADNGIFVTAVYNEKDAVTQEHFTELMGYIADVGINQFKGKFVLPSGKKYENNDTVLTRGDAMVLYTTSMCGERVAELKGIFKSPFSDIKESDKFIGYYSIAWALGAVEGTKLSPAEKYTYGELITLVYDALV